MLLLLLNIVLFLIGLYGVLMKRNLIKKIIAFCIMEYALNLFFVLIGYRTGGQAPIFEQGSDQAVFVDPLPQAIVLTSIVIGFGVTAMMVGLCIRAYQHYKTFDILEIRRLKG